MLNGEIRYSGHHGNVACVDSAFHGATLNSSNIPGIANTAHNRKKPLQPIASTSQPVAALAKVRGIAIRLVNSANCVAV
jgi:hypothetical protein